MEKRVDMKSLGILVKRFTDLTRFWLKAGHSDRISRVGNEDLNQR